MPHNFFDIEEGHRLVYPSGRNFKDDLTAIECAKVIAIQVSMDTPRIDPTRCIAVLDANRKEIFANCGLFKTVYRRCRVSD